MSTAINPDLVARFKAALDRLNPEGGKIGLAVSGGPDSMAMLLLAQEAIPGAFEVATVDHGLRPEAKDECALVVAACEERGVPCEVLTVQVGEGNLQAMAREARYAALYHWAARRELPFAATAHHMDDQVETLLMRLARASGVFGLAGIREKGPLWGTPLTVIRPLLGFRRAELERIVAGSGIEVAQDPSNADDNYDRVRFRKALAEFELIPAEALASTASHMADADDALKWAIRNELREKTSGDVDERRYRHGAPRAIAAGVIQLLIAGMARPSPLPSAAAELAAKLERGESGNLAGILATVEGDEWVFRREPPRRTG